MTFYKKSFNFKFSLQLTLYVIQIFFYVSHNYQFVVKEVSYRRLCSEKKILTVNGRFPGPTIYARKGETIQIKVYNKGKYNITIHWHGVKQPQNPWSDGPEYITQCPIKPQSTFNYEIDFSMEEGTLWWHAHSDWSRATVHGAIVVKPKKGISYPFPKPYAEIPIILGEWWKKDIMEVLNFFRKTGGDPNISDAYTINGQPGNLYPCSKSGTFKVYVDMNKTYLLRIVNAVMNEILFFAIDRHQLTVVGTDGSYTEPLIRDFIVISPGQTIDVLFHSNHCCGGYYMATKPYFTGGLNIPFDNTSSTAIVEYKHTKYRKYGIVSTPSLPYLPDFNDTTSFLDFSSSLKSLSNRDYPIHVPLTITTDLESTVSVNTFPCPINSTCEGPNGTRLLASMNNISFVNPSISILEAYYKNIQGIYGVDFPKFPPFTFNFTAEYLPLILETPKRATKVLALDYDSMVELVIQGTSLVGAIDHPMHLHGYSFYVVGLGLGNFDKNRHPLYYNLVNPPLRNTITVPKNGWAVIRFRANNPGVWFMHCHIERHLTWGMDTVLIVKNGKTADKSILPPPSYMPPC